MKPITVARDLATTRTRLESELAERGFGVLTEIDVQATLQKKLGAEHEAHVILGVCNPQLAKQALDADRSVDVLLPCTVTLRDVGDADARRTEVRALDPGRAFELAAADTQRALEPLARDARERLRAALDAVAEGAERA